MLKDLARKVLPEGVKRAIRSSTEQRRKAETFGPLAPLVPPVTQMFDGIASLENFKADGEEFLRIFRDVCGLKPDEAVLDVGSGIGRKALPLVSYLDQQGLYEGIDITRAGIEWCRRAYAPYSNFRFQHIDVFNRLYNPAGRTPASEYRFPFENQSFDFVMLGSVFTHMLPADLENYLREVRRVLKSGGRCLITYFLLNDESLGLIRAGKSTIDFKYAFENYRIAVEESPEDAIAYDESWIRRLYQKHGLDIRRLDYGSWCGRERYLSYQDLVLAA